MIDKKNKILLLTHGGWGKTLVEKITMIVGPVEGVIEVALESTDSPEDFLKRVDSTLKNMPDNSLVLTDIAGGTPSNVALQLSAKYKIHILSGLNSIMLIEAIIKKDNIFTEEEVISIQESSLENCKYLKL